MIFCPVVVPTMTGTITLVDPWHDVVFGKETGMGAATVRLPLVRVAPGFPSLNRKLVQVRGVIDPCAPTTLNLMKINVPDPASGCELNATMRIWPDVQVLGVMLHPVLSVPLVSKDGLASCITLVLKVNVKSYPMTFCPVVSPTVTGTITLVDPGLAVVFGKETAMLTAGLSEEEAPLPETFPNSETAVRPAGTETNDNIKPKTSSSNGLRVTTERL